MPRATSERIVLLLSCLLFVHMFQVFQLFEIIVSPDITHALMQLSGYDITLIIYLENILHSQGSWISHIYNYLSQINIGKIKFKE